MNTTKKFDYIAFYDLDHTILEDNSATHLVNEARKRGIMSGRRFRHAIWLSILYKLRIGNPTKMIIRMLSWLEGLREDDIEQFAWRSFQNSSYQKFGPKSWKPSWSTDQRGEAWSCCLLPRNPFADRCWNHLEMDDLICSKLESVNGILTGKTKGKLVYGKEKANRLIEYCKVTDTAREMPSITVILTPMSM